MRGPFTISISDSSGNLIRTFPGSTRKGLNSVELAMRMPAPLTAESEIGGAFGSAIGPLLAEGVYTVELNKAGLKKSTTVLVVTDTVYKHSAEDRAAQQRLVAKLYKLNEELAITVAQVKAGLDSLMPTRWDSPITDSLNKLHKSLVNSKMGLVTGEEQLRERLSSLFGEVNSYLGKPTSSQEALASTLELRVEEATRTAGEILKHYSFETRTQIEARLRKARSKK